ncbi:MAG: DALR anticodon-binding domain-containing protein [Leptolyngbyaceae cyanobacterium bins.349]|nr:DALR anticodon-binding domain-containing protein [Leptolyngbyaceae cyanobacterium bins.349]
MVPIPVKRLRRSDEIVYQSALPQLLSRTDPCQVHAIAQGLVEKVVHLQHAESSNPPCLSLQPAVLRGFTVSATAAGQLQMKLLDGAIADWLEILLHSCHLIMAMPGISTPPSCSAQRLFAIQHAHARCCSLLRYAGREAWIKPLNPEEDLCSGIFAEPNQRCWTPHSLQRLQRSERQLAHQLVELLDLLAESPQELATHLFHHLENISATFQICHQRYQLFNPQSTSSDRQEVFLTLILTTQRVLFYSLRLLSFVAAFQL